jgi:hypothetical protein
VAGGDKARLLCIGTHHKTGTIWMRKLFREVAGIYARRHGAALKALGYAQDDGWVAESGCPPAVKLAA